MDKTNTWHTEGIQSLGSPGTPLVESASKCTAQAFLQSRSVKLRAACVNTSSTVSIASLSHNSAAIDMKRRANLSCMDVKEMVSLAAATGVGEHPGCQVGRRRWLEVENCSSWLPACRQQHLRFPFPWDRQVRLRLTGSMVLQEGRSASSASAPRFTISGCSLFVRRGIFDSLTRPSGPAKGFALR